MSLNRILAATTISPRASLLMKRKREPCRISSTLIIAQAEATPNTSSATFTVVRPTTAQLRQLFLCSAIPMVGFGFMDNFVMITAGSYVDATLGVTLGASTLTAAALGNAVSDVSGVLFGGALERSLSKLNFAVPPPLTACQRALPISRNVHTAGSAIGVFLGCLLGACTLFLRGQVFDDHHTLQNTNNNNTNSNSNNDHTKELVQKLIQMHVLDGVEQTSIYYLDHNNNDNTLSKSAQSCRTIRKAIRDSSFVPNTNNAERDNEKGFSILCVPIIIRDEEERSETVVAVIEFIRSSSSFTMQDEAVATVLANAAGVLLQQTKM